MDRLSSKYRITDDNLKLRQGFIRLTEGDIRLLAGLVGWIEREAESIAREFYDHQFSFPTSLRFFETHAQRKGHSMTDLRRRLEGAQAGYMKEIFLEAANGGRYGTEYFDKRLHVGKLHNLINLPVKWYVGAYALYADLFHSHLARSFPHRPFFRAKVEAALNKIFNYDIQAVTDSFFFDYLESIGLDVQSIQVSHPDQDLSDQYEQLKTVVRRSLGETLRTTQVLQASSNRLAEDSETARSAILEVTSSVQQVANSAENLAKSVDETSSSIEEMTAAIRQVATNADNLGAVVSETSASIEEMTMSIQQVAQNVTEANGMAEEASQAATQGSKAVEQTIVGMTRINQDMADVVRVIEALGQSSQQIGNIIEVIDDIAEQTNLLALNAAIEAARAGEHGRGFAVVADEVRKLAERSGKATQEIAQLIKGIQKETEQAVRSTQAGSAAIQQGTSLAKTAGQALEAIVGSVVQVGSLMGQITHAMAEQTRAAEQINHAVVSMTQVSHQVTGATREQAIGSEQIVRAIELMSRMSAEVSLATREQTAASSSIVSGIESITNTSHELRQQADSLGHAVAAFRDMEAGSTVTAVVPRASAHALR